MSLFQLKTIFEPKGDQPQAIRELTRNLREGVPFQTLLGVTGSGKTLTVASVIANLDRPTLIISHNKTLAAQLYQECKEFFPENAVHYFISYYDYYQPEAYLPQTDTYIEKDAKINALIDQLRHAATQELLVRRDVIVVASVSCIYGLGEPTEYERVSTEFSENQRVSRKDALKRLAALQYRRNDLVREAGSYAVRGERVEVRPVTAGRIIMLEWSGNVLERIRQLDADLTAFSRQPRTLQKIRIFPAKHFVTSQNKLTMAMEHIRDELRERLAGLKKAGKLLEAQRLEQRTRYDLEMLRETGYCSGIENYSRHLDFRRAGQPPATLIDYFRHAHGSDWLLFIDESHMTVPQLRGMQQGDRARKETLVEYGFRLPSALDNRPLNFGEFEQKMPQTVFVSATPQRYELEKSGRHVIEQLIRPTGLVDPAIEVHPTTGQIEHLMREIAKRVRRKERTLVITITKRLAEELADYLEEKGGFKVRYLHSEVKTLERPEILKDLRRGTYDVIVGINLLREGLDLPEVSLVAILDADKEGFLRNQTTLIQTMGRAARHVNGHVILYADAITQSMRAAIAETERRRRIQETFNEQHNVTPKTVEKAIREWAFAAKTPVADPVGELLGELLAREGYKDLREIIGTLQRQMREAAKNLEFERAATLRDQIAALKKRR